MIHIRDIDHIVLRVVDLPAMPRFCCDGLGCRIERRQDEIGLNLSDPQGNAVELKGPPSA